MRRDMKRVIVGTGRRGEKTNKRRKRIDPESEPKREAMREGRRDRMFGDHTTPLWRFVDGRVGQPWDKVWGEIARVTRGRRSTLGHHARDHVSQWVNKVGAPFALVAPFLIDEDGVLRRNDRSYAFRKARRPEAKPVTAIDVGAQHFDLIDGVWFRTTWETLPPVPPRRVVTRSRYRSGRWEDTEEFGPPPTIVCRVRGLLRAVARSRVPGQFDWRDSGYNVLHRRCVRKEQANSRDLRGVRQAVAKAAA